MSDEPSTTPPPPVIPADAQPSASRGRVVGRVLAVVGLLIVSVAGVIYFANADHAPEPQAAAGPAGGLPVTVVTVRPRKVPLTSEFLAQTEPSQTVEVRPLVSGLITGSDFEEGQPVSAGQTLFTIDPRPFEVALRSAKAGLAAAEAQLERANQQVSRFEGLAELQRAAQNELEQAQEQQRVATAQIETQRALISQAELDLDYATVESPIDGVVGQRRQDVGNFTSSAGSDSLAIVRQVDPLHVRFSVSEQDLLRWQRLTDAGLVNDVRADQLGVTVLLPDGRTFPHKGHIDYLDVAVDPSTGTAVTRATVPNPDRTLLPGQFVTARISGVERQSAIVVPKSAVMQTPAGSVVYVVDAEGVAQVRPIEPGDWTDDGWIIDGGLSEGDRVIVDNLMKVRPGVPVEPNEPAAAE